MIPVNEQKYFKVESESGAGPFPRLDSFGNKPVSLMKTSKADSVGPA